MNGELLEVAGWEINQSVVRRWGKFGWGRERPEAPACGLSPLLMVVYLHRTVVWPLDLGKAAAAEIGCPVLEPMTAEPLAQ